MQQQTGQYDFFMSNPQAPTGRKFGAGGMNNKWMFVGIMVGVLIVVGLLINFALNLGKPKNSAQLIQLAQQQQELIRVAEIGLEEARENQSRQLAMTTVMSISSDFNALKTALRANKVKVKDKTLSAGKNPKTDEILEKARQSNQFDAVFLKTLQAHLVDYQKNMNTNYKATTNPALKKALQKQYQNASIIINVKPEE